MGKTFEFFINLDERGEFFADVRDPDGKTVHEIRGFEVFEDGFMRHKKDLDGLRTQLIDNGVISDDDALVMGD